MLECGVKWPKIQAALNFDLSWIQACFLSHEHKDHSVGVNNMIKAGIDVYGSLGTLDTLGFDGYNRRINHIADKTLVRLDGFDVLAFEVHHDAKEPLGFIIRADDEYMLFCTDTSHISQRFSYPFSIIAIEASYDITILQDRVDRQDINETLAKRLLTSHTEKQTAMRYLADYCDMSRCRELHLLHLSSDNINREQTKKDFEKRFFIDAHIIGLHGCPASLVRQ